LAIIADPLLDVVDYACGEEATILTQNFHEILRVSFNDVRQILAIIADKLLDVGNYACGAEASILTQNFHEIL